MSDVEGLVPCSPSQFALELNLEVYQLLRFLQACFGLLVLVEVKEAVRLLAEEATQEFLEGWVSL